MARNNFTVIKHLCSRVFFLCIDLMHYLKGNIRTEVSHTRNFIGICSHGIMAMRDYIRLKNFRDDALTSIVSKTCE